MIAAVAGVLYFLGIKDQPGAFWGFFAMFMILFFATGVGNASTFQMIPAIMRKEMPRLDARHAPRRARRGRPTWKSAAIIGFTSAIAAYGAFFIPKSYGTSIALTGGPEMALWGFLSSTSPASPSTWWLLHAPRRPAARHRARRRRCRRAARATGRMKETRS